METNITSSFPKISISKADYCVILPVMPFSSVTKIYGVNPKSEVGEHARLGCSWPRLAASLLRVGPSPTPGSFRCFRIFREGAENSARGGRAPHSISEFGLIAAGLLAIVALPLVGQGAAVDFNRDIRPILSGKCFACHGPDEKARKAKLRLDRPDGAIRDLGGYAAVVPGKPEASELLKRVTTADVDDLMPPPEKGSRLTEREVNLFRQWIKEGGDYAVHWSYKKVIRPEVPAVDGSAFEVQGSKFKVQNPIDAFIFQRLAREGLRPSAEADRWTLARRAAMDLTGLPPTNEELLAFVHDQRPQAYERYVDTLLAKETFGEHWAGLWLDLARYADSAGYPSDPGRTIWAYRDWVIRAFNRNMPYDQFTIEQMAGDLLPKPTEDQMIATAFHRNTMTQNEGGTSDEEFRVAAIIDRVNTTMAVWMGTSMACAQCHSHKFDPITQNEYFQFYAFLNNTADADKRDESPLFSFYTEEQKRNRSAWQSDTAELEEQFKKPDAKWLKGLARWDDEFSGDFDWSGGSITAARSGKGAKIEQREGGSLFVAQGKANDQYTIELKPGVAKLTALRLESLPDDKLPGKGAGHGKGNFNITKLTAELVPQKKGGREGRFVRIELPGKKFLQVAEVQVFSGGENIAVKGEAKQSSDYVSAFAKLGNDGNTNGHYYEGMSVAHTSGKDEVAWWEVDLKKTAQIDRIVFWNRTDGGAGARLQDWRIQLLDEKRELVWSQNEKEDPKPRKEFDFGGPQSVPFKTATADFTENGFTARTVLTGTPIGKSKNVGWAVGGKVAVAHSLTLLPAKGVSVPTGATLRVNIQLGKDALGQFRISVTDDARVSRRISIPETVLAALAVPSIDRSENQRATIRDHYVRNVAPEAAKERVDLVSLKKKLTDLKPITIPIMEDLIGDKRRETRIQVRGNWQNLTDIVKEGTPSAFHPLPADAPRNRLTLARWLVDKDNPLTPRVAANRFWEALFGTGLVRTSEEFGAQGEQPTHPELLNWLAAELLDSKWNVKRFLKLLVTSATYRQSAKVSPELLERDAANALLARAPRVRATGETLRDQALFVSGLFSSKMYGPSVRPERPKMGLTTAFGKGNDWETSKGEDRHRRSIYTEVRRNSPYPSFTTFDASNREVCTIRRSRSNTPLQAFVTLNDPVFVEAAQAFGRRIVNDGGKNDAERLEFAFLTATSRPVTEFEKNRLMKLLAAIRAVYASDADMAKKMATEPLGPAPQEANLAELASWAAVANVILNLDEMIMKR